MFTLFLVFLIVSGVMFLCSFLARSTGEWRLMRVYFLIAYLCFLFSMACLVKSPEFWVSLFVFL